jgi:hypothetical protein
MGYEAVSLIFFIFFLKSITTFGNKWRVTIYNQKSKRHEIIIYKQTEGNFGLRTYIDFFSL